MTSVNRVAAALSEAKHAIAFTGAGISTESGIPDFRSPGGVWARYEPVYFDEFLRSAAARREYWRQKSEAHDAMATARPNGGHRVLSQWEAAGRLAAIITQNIDELHQAAGSRNVFELHGSAQKIGCLDCTAAFPAGPLVLKYRESGEPPPCPVCGGWLKHATISFGQALPEQTLRSSIHLARQADLVLAVGSSLVVEPAASIPRLTKQTGGRLVIINRDETGLDHLADEIIRGPIGDTLEAINRAIDLP